MEKLIAMILGMAFLGGCAMKEFSSTPFYSGSEVTFTGAVEDRVNLWPLGYWREPVGSVAWPLVSWGTDHFAMRPLYSQYKQGGSVDYSEFNVLWPVCQFDTKHDDCRFFPLFWGDMKTDDKYFCLFPALWWNKDFAGVIPFFWECGDDDVGFGVFPLFWSEVKSSGRLWNTLFPLYYYQSNEEQFGEKGRIAASGSKFWAFCGLAGYNRYDGTFTDHRFLPLYYNDQDKFLTPLGGKSGDTEWMLPLFWRDETTFASLPYWCRRGTDGENDSVFSLPLLSGYTRDRTGGDRLLYLFMGLGGRVWNDTTGGASWVFPLYYSDSKSFYTLLYGSDPRRAWLFPFYYRDETQVNTIPFSYWDDAKKGTRGFFSLPLLSGANWSTNTSECTWLALAGLVGGKSDASGKVQSEWAFPAFHREKGKSFSSLPYGWSGGGTSHTNTYFACGLAGAHAGSSEGGWLFPLFNHKKDADFDEKSTWLNRDSLPDEVKVTTRLATNRLWNAKTKKRDIVKTSVETNATYVSSWNEWSHFLFSDNDRRVSGNKKRKQKAYTMTASHKMGNRLFFRREKRRSVDFDLNTRKKVSDVENGWHSFLPLGYCHEWKTDAMKGTSKQSHRVLWKLWDWEEENGDVSLDVFPGFTYDSKTNGYAKTSFLWRFFRYERDPERGTAVDFLFIPVWR